MMGGDIAYHNLIKTRQLLYIGPVSYLGWEFHGAYVTVLHQDASLGEMPYLKMPPAEVVNKTICLIMLYTTTVAH